mgnify:CR=1 FL=1
MSMQTDLIKQWIEFNKLAIDSFKKIATNNVMTTNQMLTSAVDPSALAELTKSSITLFKDLGKVYTDSVNEVFRTQLKLVNLQATSEAYKHLGEIYLSSMQQLGEQQGKLMQLYIETMANYLDELKDSKKVEDLATVQANVLAKLQDKVKDNMIDTMSVLNSLNSAMEVWTKKSLDAIAESNKSSS